MNKYSFSLILLILINTLHLPHTTLAFHRQGIGLLQWAFPLNNIIVVASQDAVAALNFSDGSINWRQLLDEPVLAMAPSPAYKGFATLSYSSESSLIFVRYWSSVSGKLQFESTFLENQMRNEQTSLSFVKRDQNRASSILFTYASQIYVISASDGSIIKKYSILDGYFATKVVINYELNEVFVYLLPETNCVASKFRKITMKVLTINISPETGYGSVEIFDVTFPWDVVTYNNDKKCPQESSKFSIIDASGDVAILGLLDEIVVYEANTHFDNRVAIPFDFIGFGETDDLLMTSLIHLEGDSKFALDCTSVETGFTYFRVFGRDLGAPNEFKYKNYDLLPLHSPAKIISTFENNNLITSYQNSQGLAFYLHDNLETLDAESFGASDFLLQEHGDVNKLIHLRGDISKLDTFTLAIMEDYSISLLSKINEIIWTREEALSKIIEVKAIDYSFGNSGQITKPSLSFPSFTERVTNQYNYLKYLISAENDFIASFSEWKSNRLLIVLTQPGKVFGIDSYSGEIIWSFLSASKIYGSKIHNQLLVFEHSFKVSNPDESDKKITKSDGRIMIRLLNHPRKDMPQRGKVTEYVEIDAMLGTIVKKGAISQSIKKAYLFPSDSHSNSKALMLAVNNDDTVQIFPNGGQLENNIHFPLINAEDKIIQGYLYSNESSLESIWTIKLPYNEIILGYTSPQQMFHSSLNPFVDDNYKFLSTSLVVLFTRNTEQDILYVSFIDIITGNTMKSLYIEGVESNKVSFTSQDNVYYIHYYNSNYRRYEISVIELYHPKKSQSSTAAKYKKYPLKALQQTYIFPASVNSISISKTKYGISPLSVIVSLKSGSIVRIDTSLLNARRSTEMKVTPKPGSVPPYNAIVPIQQYNILSKDQTIGKVTNVVCSETELESTSLIIAYGLDLFTTDIAPTPFDRLSGEFNVRFLVLSLGVVISAVLISHYFVQKKRVDMEWL